MSKTTANKAIDFTRLFAVKDQLASKAAEVVRTDARAEKRTAGPSSDARAPSQLEPPRAAETATAIHFHSESAPHSNAADAITELRPPPMQASEIRLRHNAADAVGPLRIGLPRRLHERVRASAALACLPPTALVRDLLESAAPHFDASAPLSELTRLARAAFPEASCGRRVTEVRMQVPLTEDLHRRLVQLAALRAQTLGGCLLDLLEHRLPR